MCAGAVDNEVRSEESEEVSEQDYKEGWKRVLTI